MLPEIAAEATANPTLPLPRLMKTNSRRLFQSPRGERMVQAIRKKKRLDAAAMASVTISGFFPLALSIILGSLFPNLEDGQA